MDHQILQEAADRYPTPSYLFDLDAFTGRIRHVRDILGPDIHIYYAMKANPFLAGTAAFAAHGLEVCSPGEYAICRRAGIPAEKIVLSGVNKDPKHIREVMGEQGAGTYTAESPGQLRLLEAEAARRAGSKPVPVLLRLTSGNQFGMDEETILALIRERDSYPHLNLAGLQYYSGTQKKQTSRIQKELLRLDRFMSRIREEGKFEISRLEYGPGLYIPYFKGEEEADEDSMLRELKGVLDNMAFKGAVSLEAGRFLAAPCGSYITHVVDAKHSQGQNYCIVDGGINHVNYYGQAMAMKVPPIRFMPQGDGRRPEAGGRSEDGMLSRATSCAGPQKMGVPSSFAGEAWTVCGSLCTSGDILAKNLSLPGLETGDLLVFDRIGAYSVTEGIYLFLSRKLPCILIHSRDKGLSLVRRDLPTDLLNDGSGDMEESTAKQPQYE